ncbi:MULTISPECIES: DNA methyltransferase [Bacteroidota]|uniref:Methyltransferase n=2 Tax=Bacteroidota TaxID=976 RepID=A0A2T5C6J1_9BACT|nr:DNA methyltransferase [Mangrovibacterium marinum]PTN10573.1 DNA methylase [Mangrovibacterium marinum]
MDQRLLIEEGDFLNLYKSWDAPTVIISDGPYGIGGFPGDPKSAKNLGKVYEPFIKAWAESSTPNTTLWFWNTELGWANVHPVLEKYGWEFVNCHIWNKGKAHIAGNANTKTLRKLPVVTEVCVQYVLKPEFVIDGNSLSMQEWLRYEWKRTGLPLSKTNEACGVKNAATRKYFTTCDLWYFPPSEAFEKFTKYANENGKVEGKPYFSLNGIDPISKDEWDKMRAKFKCPFGVSNVWEHPPLNGKERLKNGSKSLHLNQKPLKLMEIIIDISSDIGDVIWEPFGGLFSGAIAAHNLNRVAYASEINGEIFKHAENRVKSILDQPKLNLLLDQ